MSSVITDSGIGNKKNGIEKKYFLINVWKHGKEQTL
jgi:hypothetical protein